MFAWWRLRRLCLSDHALVRYRMAAAAVLHSTGDGGGEVARQEDEEREQQELEQEREEQEAVGGALQAAPLVRLRCWLSGRQLSIGAGLGGQARGGDRDQPC
jgi:hypothetical protein